MIINIDDKCFGNPIRAGYKSLLHLPYKTWITSFSGCIADAIDILLVELHVIHLVAFVG